MISLPRDTYVEIPGHGANKLNAAFAKNRIFSRAQPDFTMF